MRILYADANPSLFEVVGGVLACQKYTVDAVSTGLEALACAATQRYDGMVLSAALPGLDGLNLLRELRLRGDTTPVLLLTSRRDAEERVAMLDAGADDCLSEPFSTNELLARTRAMLRRRDAFTPDTLQVGNLCLDQHQAQIFCQGEPLALSRLEYQMLSLFMLHPGMSFSAEHLLEQIWGMDSSAEVSSVWVYISYLRKKLSACGASAAIRSKRGIGYSLEVQQ
ncbi:MAG: response regulator transcription factor [Clostridia bacterium]|nr:response regulator transcription factor [Clostridia bacterium]